MSLFNPYTDIPHDKPKHLFGKGNNPFKKSLFNVRKPFKQDEDPFAKKPKLFNKLSGGEQTEVSAFTLLIVVIISFVIVIAVYYFAMRDPEASRLKRDCKSACKQINKQCNDYCNTDFVDDWRQLQNNLQNQQTPPIPELPTQYQQQAPPQGNPGDFAKSKDGKPEKPGKQEKEGFLRSKFAAVYKESGEPMCVNDWCTIKTAYDNINNGIMGLSKNSRARRKPASKRKEGYEQPENNKEANTTTSEEGASKKCERDFMTKLYRKGPLSGVAVEKCLDCPSVEPVVGFSNGNTRVNGYYPMSNEACIDITKCSKTKGIEPFTKLDNVIIDDKGYSNREAYIPTNCNTPMCSNSRLTGSAMNCSALVGAFRKFDTDPNFFKSPAPFPPKLNFLKGEPAKLKYCSHPDF